MTRRSILVAVILACLTITLSLSPDEFFLKSALAEKGEGAIQKELPLSIQKIYLKGNKVFITIVRTGGGKVDPDDFSKIRMKVDPGSGKPSRQWSLTDVDRSRVLSAAGGKIEFDTGIILEKGETVKAILSFGKWETSKQEVLSLTTTTALAKTIPPPSEKADASKMESSKLMMAQETLSVDLTKTNMMASKAVHERGRTGRPMNIDDAGGIRITVPGEGQRQRPGDSFPVYATFTRELSDPTAVGYVDFTLRRFGVSDVFATHRQPYRQSSDGTTCMATVHLPATGLPPGSDYYFMATHPEAWGTGNSFTINAPGGEFIRVTGRGGTPGTSMEVGYQFTSRVGSGTVRLELYKLEEAGRYGRPVLTRSSHYTPGSASTPDPIHLVEWQLPPDLAVGRYFVLATHPEAWGKSSNFEIRWEGEGHDFPSDYAVVNIFKQGNDFKARLRATGGDMADSIPISVNGEIRREIIRPAGDTVIVIRPVDYGREGCGVTHEVTIDPNNTFHEENRANNTLRKFVPIEDPDGYAKVEGDIDSRGRLLFPCEPPRYSSSLGRACISVRNCSSEPVSVSVTAQQVGWRDITNSATYFIRNRRVYSVGGVANGEPIPPGESMKVSVLRQDLDDINSTLVFSFSGGSVSRWRHLTNPLNVPVRFGRSVTYFDTRRGTRETRCEYVDW